MKPKFFDGCKVKIQNFDRGYDGNKEWKVVFEWPLGGLAGHVVVPEDNLQVL